jgi:hypothetical protein
MNSRIETPGDGILIGGAGEIARTSRDVRILFNHFHAEERLVRRLARRERHRREERLRPAGRGAT